MQTDHRVPTTNTAEMRQQQHRKRSFSGINPRKRDRQDLICVVCHAPAMGYNFDQITCESCKAFFRRNALNNADKFQCRSSNNDCVITLETRKRCKACRLKKCFDKGLRKEWIMSEEEKRTKKQKIEDNRRLRAMSHNSTMFSFTPSCSPPIVPETDRSQFSVEYQTRIIDDDGGDDYEYTNDNKHNIHLFDETNDTMPDDELSNNKSNLNQNSFDYKTLLDFEDRILLIKIEEDYTRAVHLNKSVIRGYSVPCLRNLNDVIDVVNEPAQMSTLRMITFLKLTPQFNCLHEDDRLALVKHNLLAVLYLHACICTDLDTEIFHEPNTIHDFCYHMYELRRFSDEVYTLAMELIKDVKNQISSDHLVIKLIILIMIFSKGSDFDEPIWLEPQKIFLAQNIFINLLWKYLDIRYGYDKTASIYSHLIFACMKAQNIGRKTKEAVTKQTVNSDDLAPLMQSVILNS
ncbi:unnamed protein product [Adineta steineri]|uniref:Nuclear receptor domain-containing protein n=1 Tax=Adineta steineri TaxID=433720 RepID=A0A815DMM3_9BILA|nr:unnamed protein product [Adineta steineri]CAF1298526.1 unnamed protein product [Adineta steineri]CAF3890565.1 unnamed protein product [Adineta steineri]CAF4006942.1 unnamed protein product [Adineta steineri]